MSTALDPHATASTASDQIREIAAAAGMPLDEKDCMPHVHFGPDLRLVAWEIGGVVSRLNLFVRSGELVYFDNALRAIRPMDAATFRTWINEHVRIWARINKDTEVRIPMTLRDSDAKGILCCMDFRRGVRSLRAVNSVRLPVLRPGGELELLPWGYDDQTETFTMPGGLEYKTDAALEVGKVWLDRLDGEFPFSDGRSRSVHRAGMLALYCKHLPGGGGLRPGFVWLGNQPGVGKSILAKACLYPVLGSAASMKLKAREDLDKELEAFSRARVPYIFLDNVYHGVASASIDQLLTSKRSAGRALGGHDVFEAENTALLLITGNGLELNRDASRRFSVVDLFEQGELGDRKVTARIDDDLMETEEWRAQALSALFALVRHWVGLGRPESAVQMPSFERFTATIGGIVEAAGYVPPFTPAVIPDAISPGKEEFVTLLKGIVAEMGEDRAKVFPLTALARIARSCGVFELELGTREDGRRLMAKEEGLTGEDRRLAEDRGSMSVKQRQAIGYKLKEQCGKTHREIPGLAIEFGKRKEARTSEFTVTVSDS